MSAAFTSLPTAPVTRPNIRAPFTFGASTAGTLNFVPSGCDFSRYRQLTLIVYSPPGSAYDIYGRVLVKHMGRHIPGNPNFIAQYVVGAGGLKAIETLYKIAPKDGTVIGTVGRGLPFEPFLGKNELKYDPLRCAIEALFDIERGSTDWYVFPLGCQPVVAFPRARGEKCR